MKTRKSLKTIIIIIIFCFTFISAKQYKYPFQNPKLSIEERVDNILELMTLQEKIRCLDTEPDVPRLGIDGSGHVEGYHGLAMGGPANWAPDPPIPTTQFPQAIGMAKTWNPELIKKAGKIESYEARYIYQKEKYEPGGLVIRAPNADLARDPRWGRTEETFGEDPYFAGRMVSSFVKGIQGDHSKYWRAASLMKHFLANSNEDNRVKSSSNFGERLFREYYAFSFKKGVLAGSESFMTAYNAYNEIPCTVHPIIKNIAKEEWGVNGIICTDAGSFRMMITEHNYFSDTANAAAATINAGINQFLDDYKRPLKKAIEDNLLSESDLDNVLRGVFRVMIKLGELDPPEMVPYSNIGEQKQSPPWQSQKHKSVAHKVTQESIVLLKNENDILPLQEEEVDSIAVLGPRSDQVLLDWYSGKPPYKVTPLEGIKELVGDNVEILTAPKDTTDSTSISIAEKAEMSIVFVGNHPTGKGGWGEVKYPSWGKEAVDRKSLKLKQEELIKNIYRANRNTIVVLLSSFPYSINWSDHNIPAILHTAQNSQELGTALAEVIFGKYNPGGSLVQTWPRSIDQLPQKMDYNIRNGHTYRYFKGDPLYSFGYGLSYTDFNFSNMQLSSQTISPSDKVNIKIDVKNTGQYKGDEVIQLYIKHLNSNRKRPQKELKGFKRISLAPEEKKQVEFSLKAESLHYWNPELDSFMLENDKVKIMVGKASSDIKMEKEVNILRE